VTIPGLAFGVDTTNFKPKLAAADWTSISAWRNNQDPAFLGRYFDAKPGHAYYWADGEGAATRALTNSLPNQFHGNPRYVFPLQSGVTQCSALGAQTNTTLQDTAQSWTEDAYVGMKLLIRWGTGQNQTRTVKSNTKDTLTVDHPWATTPDATSRYELGKRPNKIQGLRDDGTAEADRNRVRAWGTDDANSICRRIMEVVQAGDLQLPDAKMTVIYLDVEWNWRLSPDYWYGWASMVYWYCTGLFSYPFLPGLYCPTMHDPDQPLDEKHHCIPDLNVVTWPQDLSNALWVKSNMTAVFDQKGVDGVANSASSLLANAANATCLRSVTLPEAKRYQSAWFKRLIGHGVVSMTMDGGKTWSPIAVPPTWSRHSIPPQIIENPTVGFQLATNGDKIAVEFPADVHIGLTEPPNNLASRCHGIYASNPALLPNCNSANYRPDWKDRFDVWQQTVHVIFGWIERDHPVPVRLWQYAIQVSPPDPGFVSGVNVDLDETAPDPVEAVKYMLKLP